MRHAADRRLFLRALSSVPVLLAPWTWAEDRSAHRKPVPGGSGETLPVIGMGTSETFDVALDDGRLAELGDVLQRFFALGGEVIDSSPMYGNAESVVGALLPRAGDDHRRFIATKVWTDGREAGIAQMNASMRKLATERIDLMQIHNLRDWQAHLPTLRAWKEEGRIRYLGITTSHGRDHEALMQIMKTEPLDFVQFSYSLGNRAVEADLLPLAADRGIATLVNRPFERGGLFARIRDKPLPGWAADIDCTSWGQVFLKFVVSHPAVTCAIPATSRLAHMVDNMAAGFGRMPDASMRKSMITYFESL